MKRLALLLAFVLALAGCGAEPGYDLITPPPGTGAFVVGTSMVIVPYLSTDQIEGGPQLSPVDDIRSDNPSIVRIEFTTHLYDIDTQQSRGVLVFAVSEGTTNLRLYNGGDDVGAIPITVLAKEGKQ